MLVAWKECFQAAYLCYTILKPIISLTAYDELGDVMSTLSENITQAVSDFNNIQEAIIAKGVDVPEGTPTSQYAEKIEEISEGTTPEGTTLESTLNIEEGTLLSGTTWIQGNLSLVIPEGVISVNTDALAGECRCATNITFPSTLESIGSYAFSDCYSLRTLDFSSTALSSIDNNAFYNCNSLVSLELSTTSVTTISYAAFAECRALSSIFLPSSLQVIGEQAFYDCWSLQSLDINDTSVRTIGAHAFASCYSLETLFLPAELSTIQRNAFQSCNVLELLDFTATAIEVIEQRAFAGCTNLSYLAFPNTLTSIGDEAFFSCDSLITVDLTAFDGSFVPQLGTDVFITYEHPEDFKFLFSSQEALDNFANTTNWSDYAQYFEIA